MDDCIEWPLRKDKGGYGRTRYLGIETTAHRVAWIKANGPIAEGFHVMHQCDNPPCVNLAHLKLGTRSENMRDMIAKGRRSAVILSMEKAHQIRQLLKTKHIGQLELAKRFGVSRRTINDISNNLIWTE